jgi:NAD(P)-dependent dehydrogenase (short-subunit alcohol dehydrogenase family)
MRAFLSARVVRIKGPSVQRYLLDLPCAPGDSHDVNEISKAVLITGCSSGIGRETAIRLAGNGWTVYATARRPEAIADLAERGCRVLALDVTDESSSAAAVRAVEEEHGAVGVLVNNAGINELGAIETVPMDKVRRLFETNVFGPVALTQTVLPKMREQRWGKVVTIGSMNGRFTFPGMGYYCATKHSLEAIHDAMRYELRPFGVDVVLVEPGFVKTTFGNSAASRFGQDANGSPYAEYEAKVAETAATWQEGPMAKLGCSAEEVAAVVEKAISGDGRPRARYRVAPSAGILLSTRKMLPDVAFDAFVRAQFPSPEAS